jgi:hypothetical protein
VPSPAEWRLLFAVLLERIVEGTREVGILLIAFTPLDYALDRRPFDQTWKPLTLFLVAGVLLFGLSVFGEWRLHDD